MLPVHAVKDSAQVLEERVKHELGSGAILLPATDEPGLCPHPVPEVPPGGCRCLPCGLDGILTSSCFLNVSRQAHIEVYEYFLKRFLSKLVFPSAFSKAYWPRGLGAWAQPRVPLPRLPNPGTGSIRAGIRKNHCSPAPLRAGFPKTGSVLYRNVNTEFILKDNKKSKKKKKTNLHVHRT